MFYRNKRNEVVNLNDTKEFKVVNRTIVAMLPHREVEIYTCTIDEPIDLLEWFLKRQFNKEYLDFRSFEMMEELKTCEEAVKNQD